MIVLFVLTKDSYDQNLPLIDIILHNNVQSTCNPLKIRLDELPLNNKVQWHQAAVQWTSGDSSLFLMF